MALETLKEITKIGGFDVHSDNEIADGKWSDVDKKYCVCIHHGDNTIAFRIQNGPIKENGVNGCQVETIIHAAIKIIKGLNKNVNSHYNANALFHLEAATIALERRTKDREERGVEGTSQS